MIWEAFGRWMTGRGHEADDHAVIRPQGGQMRQALSKSSPFIAVVDEVVERLARLEEQMRHVVLAVEKLGNRDSELEESLRLMSERFSAGLTAQGEMFQASLKEVTESFVTREDWAFWKSLLTAALLAMIAYGWNTLTNGLHR
jgi:hypothetical protein